MARGAAPEGPLRWIKRADVPVSTPSPPLPPLPRPSTAAEIIALKYGPPPRAAENADENIIGGARRRVSTAFCGCADEEDAARSRSRAVAIDSSLADSRLGRGQSVENY